MDDVDIRIVKKSVELWNANEEDFSLEKIGNNIISSRIESTLWTEKYRPKRLTEYHVNPAILKDIEDWIKSFINRNQFYYKPVLLLYGSAGIGKTTIAHLIFEKYGYHTVEINASDVRNKKQIKELVGKISSFSVDNLKNKKSVGLIMDEVDGMLGGDIGGIAEFVRIINPSTESQKQSPKNTKSKKSPTSKTGKKKLAKGTKDDDENSKYPVFPYKFPVIATCNSIKDKMQQLLRLSVVIKLEQPSVDNALAVINHICDREDIQLTPIEKINFIDTDYRRIINSLYQYKLRSKGVFNDTKLRYYCDKEDGQYLTPIGDTLVDRINYMMQPSLSSKLDNFKFSDCNLYLMGLYYNTIPVLGYIQRINKRSLKEEYIADLQNVLNLYYLYIYCEIMNEYSYKFQYWDLIPYMEIFGIIEPVKTFNKQILEKNDIGTKSVIVHHHPYNGMRQEQSSNHKYCKKLTNGRTTDAIKLFYSSGGGSSKECDKIISKINSLAN